MLSLNARSVLLPVAVLVVSALARSGRARCCPGSGARSVSQYRQRSASSYCLTHCEKRASGDIPDQAVDTGRDRACAYLDRQLPSRSR
jgi:hypothetical protein